jgi:isopenicillin-N N-acyltransferase-like protein
VPGPSVISVEGSYEEMGTELGGRTSELIECNLHAYLRLFRDFAGLSDADIIRWGGIFLGVIREYDRQIAAMLDGMAEGAGQRVEHLAALNARTELLYGSGYREEGCTSLAVLGKHTANGHTLLAQNWDWRPDKGPVTFLIATRDTEGFAVLSLAEAGMLAKSGLNSAGLGVCANILVSDQDAAGAGVPYHILLRGVLQAKTMSQAQRQVLSVRRISSGNVLIADASGEAIDLELAPDTFGYLLPECGLLTHSNHFQVALPLRDLIRTTSALTLLRPARARRLLEDAASAFNVGMADVVGVLRDHYSFPDSICRHPDPAVAPEEQSSSVYSIVMDLDARDLYIAAASPCTQPYARWNLDEVFSADATTQPFFAPDPAA